MPQFAHTFPFRYSQTEGGPQDGCKAPPETWQLLPAFPTVDAFLENSFITFHADKASSSFTWTDLL